MKKANFPTSPLKQFRFSLILFLFRHRLNHCQLATSLTTTLQRESFEFQNSKSGGKIHYEVESELFLYTRLRKISFLICSEKTQKSELCHFSKEIYAIKFVSLQTQTYAPRPNLITWISYEKWQNSHFCVFSLKSIFIT